jgi:hypothetical protein
MTSGCRTQAGRLHLVDSVGKIPLADVTLVEDPAEDERNDDGKNLLESKFQFFLLSFHILFEYEGTNVLGINMKKSKFSNDY